MPDEDNQRITQTLAKIHHKLLVLSGKGGVGKSTIATHLALTLANKGKKVGLMDCDFHGPSIPKLLGIEGKKPIITDQGMQPIKVQPNLSVMSISFFLPESDAPVIWRGPIKMGAIRQFLSDVSWGDLDYLIIDLPPGTGDEPLSVAQLIPGADGAVIVTTPQDVALLSVRKSVVFVRKIGMPVVGIVENMSGFSCPHCGQTIDIFKTGGGKKASSDFAVPFLGCIPLDPAIVEEGDAGHTPKYKADSQVSKAFNSITSNIENVVNHSKR
jgi:ATP-binding protein involved in chromosome partitioning